MFTEVEKYDRQPFKLRLSIRDAKALGLKPGQVWEITFLKLVSEKQQTEAKKSG